MKFCSENVQPYLASILEEIMGPISSGFQEVRQQCASHMDQLCQNFQEVHGAEELKQVGRGSSHRSASQYPIY